MHATKNTSTGRRSPLLTNMAEAFASSAPPGPPIGPPRINFEWTLPLPKSPFYKEEYCWSSNSQVHSCTLCNEELHRTPIFDLLGNIDPIGKIHLDLLSKKYIHFHFISIRHEDNLKEAMKEATGKSNTTSTTEQPNTKTQIPVHSTGTGHGTTQRRSRSRRKASSLQRTCVICKASSLHMVGTKADGPFILSSAHLDQLHHKRNITRFQELAEEETRLIEWKKPSTATAIASAVLEIATTEHDLPTDVGRLILKFSGIQEIVPTTTYLTCTTGKKFAKITPVVSHLDLKP